MYIRLTRTYGNIWARTNGSSSRGTKGSSNAEEEESQLFPSPGLLLSDTTTNTTTTTRTSSKCDTPTTKSYHIELNPMSPTPQKKPSPTAATITTIDTNDSTRIHTSRNRELRRFLLLNGYPILYLLLWIPGMANRAAELAHGKSPTWLQALQATTQLVGLANVLTYALTEKFVERLRKRFARRSGFARTT